MTHDLSSKMLMKQVVANQTGVLMFGPGGLRLSSLQSHLSVLTPEQFELLNKAKKYATEQSIKNFTNKMVVNTGQQNQQKSLQRHQALLLMCRVYVGSISFEVREETIKTAFSAYGTIKSINMSWDQITLKHKGFAFVEYELPEAAQLALEHMNGIQLGGRQIKVGRPSNMPQAKPVIEQIQEECKQNNRVYVSNVHPDVNEQDLADLFEPFGKVRMCKLAMTPNVEPAQHRGCGFIEFETEEAATEALTMNGQLNLGGTLIHVCRATTPADNVSIHGTLDSGTATHPPNSEEDIQLQLERANREQESCSESGDPVVQQRLTSSTITGSNHTTNVSPVIVLKNMVTADDELDDNLHLDVHDECSKHGPLTQIVIYIDKNVRQVNNENETGGQVYMDEIKIFVKYKNSSSSAKALESLNGRFFAGRKVSAEEYDKDAFRRHIYTQ